MKKTFYIVAVLAALFILAFVMLAARQEEPLAYASERYGFAFSWPAPYELYEYAPESIAIGMPDGEGFSSVADVRLYSAGEDIGYESFDAFITETLRNMCAADGPNESISCDRVERREPFTSDHGATGEHVYLARVHRDLTTGATASEEFGPVFVFDVSENAPPLEFAALVIQPPAHSATTTVNNDVVHAVAASLRVHAARTQ